MIELDAEAIAKRKRAREIRNRAFTGVCWASASVSVIVLAVLLISILVQGIGALDLGFLTGIPSADAEQAGFRPAIMGSIWICAICALVALPLGVGTAIFLEEYRPRQPWLAKLHGIVQLNISNLAGVPSIVYGILGLTVFVQMFNLFGNPKDPAIAIGVSYLDQVSDEAFNYLEFPVSNDAPTTQLRDGMEAVTDRGETVTVRLMSYEEIDPLHVAMEQEIEARRDVLMAEAHERAREEADAGTIPPETVEARSGEIFNALADVIVQKHLAGVVPQEYYVERLPRESWHHVQIPFGRGVLAGGLTLMLVILPIVIVASQEAIRAVPPSLREGALGLGATKWQAIRRIVLPASVPGIMTGSILAVSRAIGEAAPILILAGIVYITFVPGNLMDDFTAMPLQIYNWAGLPQKEFHAIAAGGIIVLLAILLSFNALAIIIRQKFSKELQ